MKLRTGKTKSILASSVDSALLAVEIYNKPRTTFRSEGFITMMIIAWTKLFHAYFYKNIGDKYYYKEKSGRYSTVDGEKKAWELTTCIKRYKETLSDSVKGNLFFFIKLRNKIEHRHIASREVDTNIFGECQALLFNYESLLIEVFGEQYSINEALVYSLQFSQIRTTKQKRANKSVLSKDINDIVTFVEKYRSRLSEHVYNSQEYSIKLIQIPKISNTNRSDVAIEFVNWNSLSPEDQVAYSKIVALVKDKTIKVEAVNVDRLKPGEVKNKVNEQLTHRQISQNMHTNLYKIFPVRPPKGAVTPNDTLSEFCLYDETHNDYVYQIEWVNFLVGFLQTAPSDDEIRDMVKRGTQLKIDDYRIYT